MPYRNAAGQFHDGREKDAKSKPLNNKDQHPHKQHHQADYGPPYKKRRIDKSPEATVAGAPTFSKGPIKISFTKPRSTNSQATNGTHKKISIKNETLSNVETHSDKHENVAQEAGQQEQGDKRILRSQDPGAHGTSELVLFFADYWDVISNPEEEPGELQVQSRQCRRLTVGLQIL